MNEIDGHIATAQATLNDLEGKLAAKRQALVAIDASKLALAKRLDLGQTQH